MLVTVLVSQSVRFVDARLLPQLWKKKLQSGAQGARVKPNVGTIKNRQHTTYAVMIGRDIFAKRRAVLKKAGKGETMATPKWKR
jgi:hypothetical protein